MTDKNNLEEKLEKLAKAVGSGGSIVENVMSRIDTKTFEKQKSKTFARRFIMNRFTKFAAAALIIAAVVLSVTIFDKSVAPAYGIANLPELIRNAKTIHLHGSVYFRQEGQDNRQSAKLEIEHWFDVENGRYRLYKPAGVDKDSGKPRHYTTISDGRYVMNETYHRPVKGEPWKSISFTRLSPFQARLQAYKNSYLFLMRMFGNVDQIEGAAKIGQEEIDGTLFDIWQNEFYLANGRGSRIKTWLAPHSGDIGRVLVSQKKKKDDANWILILDLSTIELDVAPPKGIFDTIPPDGYKLDNTKETAHTNVLGLSIHHQRSMVKDYELYVHIGFTLNDGSVIIAWSCPEKGDSSQANLFKRLVGSGPLPELAAIIEGLTPIPSNLGLNYIGYHLAHTQKQGNFYEWSLYVPNGQPPARSSVVGYQLNVKFEANKTRFGTLPGNLFDDLPIHTDYDFNAWVRGAMAELSDYGEPPEGVSYESVLRLAEQIRASLKE